MKKTVLLTFVALILLAAAACGKQAVPAADSSRDSLDWAGAYEGTMQGANSEIVAVVTLAEDGTYIYSSVYTDLSSDPIIETGKFEWDSAGMTITLKDAREKLSYKVGENKLIQLDENGKEHTENADQYILSKITVN